MKNTKRTILLLLPAILLAGGCAAEHMTDKASSSPEEDAFMEFYRSLFSFDREMVVGKNISLDEITQFHCVRDSSVYPPVYTAYHFCIENGSAQFEYETREGNSWPLTEEDIAILAAKDLTQEEWDELCSFLEGGHVKKEDEDLIDGDDGPWFTLYWERDRSEYRTFSFATDEARCSFEEYCEHLAASAGQ